MSNEAYHAHPALGSTSLKTLATDSPARWLYEQESQEQKDAFDIGNLAHALILEGDLDRLVRRVDFDDYRKAAARQERDMAYNDGLIPINNSEVETKLGPVYAMRDAVMDHDIASQIVAENTVRESSIFWSEDGLDLKCRPDSLATDVIWDLKTARSAKPKDFGRTAMQLGYHQSAAHYIDGVQRLTSEKLPFRFVVVENTEPYFVSVVELDAASIGLGAEMNSVAKANYRASVATGSWPAYPGMSTVSVPSYAFTEYEEHYAQN
jgi:hypothetical protein